MKPRGGDGRPPGERELDWMRLYDGEVTGRSARRLARELATHPEAQDDLAATRKLGDELREWVQTAALAMPADPLWQQLDQAWSQELARGALEPKAPSEPELIALEAPPPRAGLVAPLAGPRRLRPMRLRRWGSAAAVAAMAAGWLVWRAPAPWRHHGPDPVVQEAAAVELDEDSGTVFELPDPDGSGTMTVVWLDAFRE
jgi:hypothetical protein